MSRKTPTPSRSNPRKRLLPKSVGPSESTQDHLERIHDLVEQKGYARVTDIAHELRLSRSAVSNMVRRLAARGFVNYERYRGFTLTEAGREIATEIKARHAMLTALLELLGLEPEVVQHEVEGIEHHLKPQTLAILERLVEFWRQNPADLERFRRYKAR